jgi:hypothetical protein
MDFALVIARPVAILRRKNKNNAGRPRRLWGTMRALLLLACVLLLAGCGGSSGDTAGTPGQGGGIQHEDVQGNWVGKCFEATFESVPGTYYMQASYTLTADYFAGPTAYYEDANCSVPATMPPNTWFGGEGPYVVIGSETTQEGLEVLVIEVEYRMPSSTLVLPMTFLLYVAGETLYFAWEDEGQLSVWFDLPHRRVTP